MRKPKESKPPVPYNLYRVIDWATGAIFGAKYQDELGDEVVQEEFHARSKKQLVAFLIKFVMRREPWYRDFHTYGEKRRHFLAQYRIIELEAPAKYQPDAKKRRVFAEQVKRTPQAHSQVVAISPKGIVSDKADEKASRSKEQFAASPVEIRLRGEVSVRGKKPATKPHRTRPKSIPDLPAQ